MLTVTYTPDELRLLECAELAEGAHHNGLYDQRTCGDPKCGTPGCLIGNYRAVHGSDSYASGKFWGISEEQWFELFGCNGCDHAGRDGLKAARYVRQFVAERVKERLQA